MSGLKTDTLNQGRYTDLEEGEIVILPAFIYVQTTDYQFKISAMYKARVMRVDGQGYQTKTSNFDKNYSLNPYESLSFSHRIKEVRIDNQRVAYLEGCLKSSLPFNVKFTQLNCNGNKRAKCIGLLGYKEDTIMPPGTSMKVIAKYSLDPKYVR